MLLPALAVGQSDDDLWYTNNEVVMMCASKDAMAEIVDAVIFEQVAIASLIFLRHVSAGICTSEHAGMPVEVLRRDGRENEEDALWLVEDVAGEEWWVSPLQLRDDP